MSYSPRPEPEPPIDRGWWLIFALPALVVVMSVIMRACS